jgi:hypothetical protein
MESPSTLYCTPNGSLRYSQVEESIFSLLWKKQANLPPELVVIYESTANRSGATKYLSLGLVVGSILVGVNFLKRQHKFLGGRFSLRNQALADCVTSKVNSWISPATHSLTGTHS